MTILPDVLRILDDTLSLRGRSAHMDAESPLLDGLPEFDSMAVVNLTSALETHFGIMLPEDELDAQVFATVGSLTRFVEAQLG